MAIALSGCAPETNLVPSGKALEAITARATDARDVTLVDEIGREHEARIYFNEEARHIAESFEYIATASIVTQERATTVKEDNEFVETDATEPAAWFYVMIDKSDDDSTTVGWTSSLDALMVTQPAASQQRESPPSADSANYSAAVGGYTWAISSGESTTSSTWCQYGAEAGQITNSWSGGWGRLELRRGAIVEADDPYSNGGQNANVYSGRDATTWHVANVHVSGSISGHGYWLCW